MWRRQQTDLKKFGRFSGLVNSFVEAVIPGHRSPGAERDLRCNLAHFFAYLRGRRMRSFERITPRVISSFFSALTKSRPKSAGKTLADLALFFDWLIVTGKRASRNPVQSKLHSQLATTHLPRPYSDLELRQINSLLAASGDFLLQLAVAIGLEAGLQISEVCELRLSDVDRKKQCLRVRISNRTRGERIALFHRKTRKALAAWLRERPKVEHDYLLTANGGVPMRKHVLRSRLVKALCGPGKLTEFAFRRLAQTAAARVAPEMDNLSLMANFGWRSQSPIDQLRRLPTSESKAAYDHAMEQISKHAPAPPSRSESLDEFFGSMVSSRN
jgi:integrase